MSQTFKVHKIPNLWDLSPVLTLARKSPPRQLLITIKRSSENLSTLKTLMTNDKLIISRLLNPCCQFPWSMRPQIILIFMLCTKYFTSRHILLLFSGTSWFFYQKTSQQYKFLWTNKGLSGNDARALIEKK